LVGSSEYITVGAMTPVSSFLSEH